MWFEKFCRTFFDSFQQLTARHSFTFVIVLTYKLILILLFLSFLFCVFTVHMMTVE